MAKAPLEDAYYPATVAAAPVVAPVVKPATTTAATPVPVSVTPMPAQTTPVAAPGFIGPVATTPAPAPAAPVAVVTDAQKEAALAAAKAKADADAKAAADAAAAAKTAAEIKAANDAAAAAKIAQLKAEADLAAAKLETAATTAKAAAGDPATLSLITALQAQVAQLTASQTAASTAATSTAKATTEAQRQSAISAFIERFTRDGLGSLANKIKELAVDGATEATITLGLQETPEYKQRFAANDARLKAGLQVLTPAEYLNVEDGYRQVLREYGLNQFSTDDYVKKFIENDVSAAELSNRVSLAVQRVQNADPAILKQMTDYYGVGQGDLIGYVLDPQQQITKIQRQVAAAEIGVAAARQGLTAGAGVAEQLAAQGITQAEAQKGYATVADILPTAEKLSSIYGGTMDTYGQSEAEQEVFNSLASAQRKREALTKREVASFSGSSGMAKGITSKARGQI